MINVSDKEKMLELIKKLQRLSKKQESIETRLKQVENTLNSKKINKD